MAKDGLLCINKQLTQLGSRSSLHLTRSSPTQREACQCCHNGAHCYCIPSNLCLRYFYLYLKAVYICKYEQKVDIILGAVQFLMLAGVSGCVCVCMREISDYLSSVCGSVPFESFITQKQHFQHLLLYANVSQSKCLNMFVCEQRWAVWCETNLFILCLIRWINPQIKLPLILLENMREFFFSKLLDESVCVYCKKVRV